MCMEEMSDEWMKYTVGEEVKYPKTGQFGTVTRIDSINCVYTVNINGIDYVIPEEELSNQ